MSRLHVLGGFALEGDSGAAMPPLPTRRAEAALALLAVCGSLGCTRARLIALLWPDRDESHARHNLRDALHAIRRGLGHDVVQSQGDTLHLDPAMVTSDVHDFEEALKAGRLADAVAAYRGPLLDGFDLDASREFERWLDDERSRLFRDCLEAVKRLAKKAEQDGRWDAAADWWARAVALDRYSSRFVMRRMVSLARGGDRANALKEGETHLDLLQSDLELDPDASFVEEMNRIRSGEVGPVRFFTPGPAPVVEDPPDPPDSASRD
jgi:DNA-binding SARP family transcriptional activator